MSNSVILDVLLKHATKSNNLKIVAAIAAFFIFKYRSHAIGTHPRRDLKQPKGALPFVGHMALMLSIPGTQLYDFFIKNNEELGPVWSFSIPFLGRLIEGDSPEMVEHVLKTNFWSYEKGPIMRYTMSDLFGAGIFIIDGHEWRFQRKLASHIFNVKAFREYTSETFVVEGRRVVEHLTRAADEGTIVDLHDIFLKFTLDSFGTISFGKSFGCLNNINEKVDFAESFDDLTAICTDRVFDSLWKIRERVTGVKSKVDYHKKFIKDHAFRLIELRRKVGYVADKKDLLQLFMDTKDDDGNPLPDDFIADIILNFTIAGRDTTAQAMSWLFYLLNREGSNPQDTKDIISEIDEILGDDVPTYETYKRLKFSEACFNESLRLYPSVPRNMKQCVQDDIFPDGTKIYKGEWFSWSSYVMGRSERIWGPDAK
ncbi:hypothetical protein BGZ76_011497, partial [Entomortierella beljakovae]